MKAFTFLLGIGFLAAGFAGLAPAALAPMPVDSPATGFALLYGNLFGVFPTNIALSLLRIATGLWALAAWRGFTTPELFARSYAMLYGALAVLGLVPGLATLAGWMPIHGNDVWLHAATAALAGYFGWRGKSAVERRGSRLDRRHGIHPVSYERRLGHADRRLHLHYVP